MLQRYSLGQLLTLTLVLLVGSTAVAVGWLLLDAARDSADQLAQRLVATVQREVRHYLTDYVDTPMRLARETARLAADDLIRTDSHDRVLRYLRFQLLDKPTITIAGIGVPSGRLSAVGRRREQGFGLVARVADAGDAGRIRTHALRDDGRLGPFVRADAFELSSRPWFALGAASAGPAWTEPYPSFRDGSTMLSAVNAVRSEDDGDLMGVVCVTVALHELSAYLSSIDAVPDGVIFVTDATGTLLGGSGGAAPVAAGAAGPTLPAAGVGDGDRGERIARIRQALLARGDLLAPSPANAGVPPLALAGHTWLVHVSRISDDFGLDWRLVVGVPRDAYLATIDARTRLSALIAIAGLLASLIVGTALARRVARPLARLGNAARRIAAEPERPHELRLPAAAAGAGSREVHELTVAVRRMTERLRGSFEQLQQMTAALGRSENQLRQLLQTLPVGVVVHDTRQEVMFFNEVAKRLLDFEAPEPDGPTYDRRSLPAHVNTALERIESRLVRLALTGQTAHVEALDVPRGNHTVPLEVWCSPVVDQDDRVLYAVCVLQDVSERRRAELRLIHNALHDALTGLANRSQLVSRLDLAIQRRRRSPAHQFALLFLDLDNFKMVNDGMGHLAGDEVLMEVARRLSTLTRDTDLAARLGGDEFVLLVEDLAGSAPPLAIAERVFEALSPPIDLQGRQVRIGTSIGVVYGDDAYAEASELLRDADIALYQAKARGRGRVQVFDAGMREHAMRRQRLEDDLREAIRTGDGLAVWFQPIVRLRGGAVVGLETLCRWTHPDLGPIAAAEFVRLAEDCGLIIELNRWVLRAACSAIADWRRASLPAGLPRVSLNLSSEEIARADPVATMDDTLAALGLPARCLGVELTERVMVNDIERARSTFDALRARGVTISIDDFGTGYSSLSYLYTLPVDALKIDQSFVRGLGAGSTNYKIVKAVVALSNELGIDAVAEGVETAEELGMLQGLGCELGQGYLISRPLPVAEVVPFLRAHAQGWRLAAQREAR